MSRIVYVCFMDLGTTGSLGIRKKVISHINVFHDTGIDVEHIFIDQGVIETNISGLHIEKDANYSCQSTDKLSQLLMAVDFSNYKCVYIRFSKFSRAFFQLLKHIHVRYKCKILLELPTYPFVGEYYEYLIRAFGEKNYRNMLRYIKAIITYPIYSRSVKRTVDRIVTFSDDKVIWGVNTICTSNGIDSNRISLPNFQEHNGIGLICVSSCLSWHGYDRVIRGLSDYYSHGGQVEVKCHIVGDGPELANYRSLISKYHLENHIICYGNLRGDALDSVYAECDIALDAMGRHRVGVYYNSSLKGKEYTCKGMPIISGVKTELDFEPNFKYYLRVPADDSPIDINKIISFYQTVKEDDHHNNIRNYAIEHYDFKVVMKPVIDYCLEK